METKETVSHRVLVSHTSPLFDLIKELGFKEEGSEGHGLKQIRKFKKGNKYIHSTHSHVILFQINSETRKKKITYGGLTIHDEILKFFAKRDPIKIK